MNRLSGLVENLRDKSIEEGYGKFASLLEHDPSARLLDIGCGDGILSGKLAEKVGTKNLVGVDAGDWRVPFHFVRQDVDRGLPFGDETFDVVTASHVIEHISDTDLFVTEIYRVLKKGGYMGIVTPNLASGLVILELLLNKQPKWACVSDQFFVRGFTDELLEKGRGFLHRRLFTKQGLVELLTHYGFEIEHTRRFGYGAILGGGILGGLYAANLLVKARKPRETGL